MRFDSRSTRTTLAALALAIGTAACAGDTDMETTDNVAGGTVDSASDAGNSTMAFRVTDVEIGKGIEADRTIRDGADEFGVRDTINASVKTEGAGNNAIIMARWTYQDGQVVEEQSQTINSTGETVTAFRLMKDTAWPKGNYKLTILLNGAAVETEDFEIK